MSKKLKKLNKKQYKILEKQKDLKQQKLFNLYKRLYPTVIRELEKNLEKAILTNDPEDFFKSKHYKSLLDNIDKEFKDLDLRSREIIKETFKSDYLLGKSRAIEDIETAFKDLSKKYTYSLGTIGGYSSSIALNFSIMDIKKIEAATNTAYFYVGKSLAKTEKALVKKINNTIQEEIVNSVSLGRHMKDTKREILKKLKNDNIDWHTVSGRKYKGTYYVEMVVRTETVKAHNEGYLALADEHGYDIVEVSKHSTSCGYCAKNWEGKRFSISGNSQEYSRLEVKPPYHPHCRHYTVIVPIELEKEFEKWKKEQNK